jgi:Domain of unknown function (DUF4157)
VKSFDDDQIEKRGHRAPMSNRPETESRDTDSDLAGGRSRPGRPAGVSDVLALQRRAGNAAVAQLLADDEEQSPVYDVVGHGGGSPIPDTTKTRMESSFGADFSQVRIHTDSAAASSARSVQAQAYTVGNDIVFGSGTPSLDSAAGQHGLAHELAHVVQQRSGPVEGTPAPGGVQISDPSDRFETQAERVADQVQAGQAQEGDVATAGAGGGFSLQRQEEEEEEGEE